jgi:hypothetical protein
MATYDSDKRSWNTPLREPWNPVIKQCLNAIDYHTALQFKTGEEWHARQAQILRDYVGSLKQWIRNQEQS